MLTRKYRDYKQVALVVISEVKIRYHNLKLLVQESNINREASIKIQASITFKKKEVMKCKWEPPQNHVQLCSDGSLKDTGGSCAGIFRRQDGSVMMEFTARARVITIAALNWRLSFMAWNLLYNGA
ncbi:hypothetical protein FRX31_005006 [Thalictrum thalictroides]|uniref:Uncharacterized protein n=1 Tax=Thalictrum thalictroides TaxID=46969 RepID=A0A7J6X926_THATH|nr:hypothetical protein FRX31_005006 [Thalictrum thalictroides]